MSEEFKPETTKERKKMPDIYQVVREFMDRMSRELLKIEPHWYNKDRSEWQTNIHRGALRESREGVLNANMLLRDDMVRVLEAVLKERGYEIQEAQNMPTSEIFDNQQGYIDGALDVLDPVTKEKIATIKVACNFDTIGDDNVFRPDLGKKETGDVRLKIKIISLIN